MTRASSSGSQAARVTHAWLAVERLHLRRAGAHLDGMVPAPSGVADPLVGTMFHLAKSRLRRVAGDLDGAALAVDLAASVAPPGWLAEQVTVERARLLVAQGDPAAATDVLDGLASSDAAASTVLARARPERGHHGSVLSCVNDCCFSGPTTRSSRRSRCFSSSSPRRRVREGHRGRNAPGPGVAPGRAGFAAPTVRRVP